MAVARLIARNGSDGVNVSRKELFNLNELVAVVRNSQDVNWLAVESILMLDLPSPEGAYVAYVFLGGKHIGIENELRAA